MRLARPSGRPNWARISANPPNRSRLAPTLRLQADEYGLQETELADYGAFQVKAERFKDPTGAYAASLEPSNRLKSRSANYLLSCDGKCPLDLASLAEDRPPARLPRLHADPGRLSAHAKPHPPIRALHPRPGRPRSQCSRRSPRRQQRFNTGPKPRSPSTASDRVPPTLAVFSYPSPQIARQQAPKFQSINGADVKRTGSFVVVALAPTAIAQKLLSQVNYNGQVQINETPPLVLRPETAGQMLVAIINLAGFVLVFCAVSGLVVGGILYLARRRFGYSGADGSLISLHLSRK